MRLLLDTHIVVWFAADPGRLRADVLEALQDERTDVPAGENAGRRKPPFSVTNR